MRLRIKQARPVDLNDAVRHAVELDAFNSAERRQTGSQGYMRNVSENQRPQKFQQQARHESNSRDGDFIKLKQVVDDLVKEFHAWKQESSKHSYNNRSVNISENSPKKRTCYKCGSEDHLISQCPQYIKSRTIVQSKYKGNA